MGAQKRTGVARSLETKAKLSRSLSGIKRDALSQARKDHLSKLHKGKVLRKTPISNLEKLESSKRLININVNRPRSVEERNKIANSLKKSDLWKESHKKCVEASKNSPLSGAFETNVSAKSFSLRSPVGLIYKGNNISFFVKENFHLFNPDDLIQNKQWNTRAQAGLNMLKPNRKKPRGSWKGWTWFSEEEKFHNQGQDILHRNIIS